MTPNVLFIHGAGDGAYAEDAKLVESLRQHLGPDAEVRYPAMPDEDNAPYDQWREEIERNLTDMPGPVVLVGHSVGASILLKWLSERDAAPAIAGLFLLANPLWGSEGWRYDGYETLELAPGFASRLPAGAPVYLYHCRDDEVVPFAHLALYAQAMPQATVRVLDTGGHQLNDDLSAVAEDIAALPW
ncbi:MAG: alpha/beta fold hydrolase [Thermomicrobiales bacterium]